MGIWSRVLLCAQQTPLLLRHHSNPTWWARKDSVSNKTQQNSFLVSPKGDWTNEETFTANKVSHSYLICSKILKFFWKNVYEKHSHGISDCNFHLTGLNFTVASHIYAGYALYPLCLLKNVFKSLCIDGCFQGLFNIRHGSQSHTCTPGQFTLSPYVASLALCSKSVSFSKFLPTFFIPVI